ncbi:S24 family peptidase [Chromobacterium amazonense]|uniref:XRE family transcriptional regulator n=1 Tax=Chromobacterium amazonense TaxID=1382803 RepID=UPI00237E3733|nr:LexA family transcriptional regulator [Chromobacterium amazonense]MDE1715799.1 S24 family peptidase [Chromobacterium amazonense]
MKIGERIAALRNAREWSQRELANRCGWDSQARIGNYERDAREPSLNDIETIASALGVTAQELLFGDTDNPTPTGRIVTYDGADDIGRENYVFVDRYDLKLSAGCGSLSWVVHEKDPLAFRLRFIEARGLDARHLKALYVSGDSMEPYLSDNDTVMIDTSDINPRNGEIYAVCYDDEWFIKRVFKEPGRIVLHSDNPKYRDIEIDAEKADLVRFFGRVVWRGG